MGRGVGEWVGSGCIVGRRVGVGGEGVFVNRKRVLVCVCVSVSWDLGGRQGVGARVEVEIGCEWIRGWV